MNSGFPLKQTRDPYKRQKRTTRDMGMTRWRWGWRLGWLEHGLVETTQSGRVFLGGGISCLVKPVTQPTQWFQTFGLQNCENKVVLFWSQEDVVTVMAASESFNTTFPLIQWEDCYYLHTIAGWKQSMHLVLRPHIQQVLFSTRTNIFLPFNRRT